MKDGTTHLAYKPEHAVDLDTGVAAPIHPADEGDTTTLSATLEVAERNLGEVGLAPTKDEPCAAATDKGYHSRKQLKAWKAACGRRASPNPNRLGACLRNRGLAGAFVTNRILLADEQALSPVEDHRTDAFAGDG